MARLVLENLGKSVVSRISKYSLIGATAGLLSLYPASYVHYLQFRTHPVGIGVFVLKAAPPPVSVVVRVDAEKHWHLNSTPVSHDELIVKLNEAFARHPNRVVYFEGDP